MIDAAVKEARRRAGKQRGKAMSDPVANPCCSVCGFAYPPVVHLHHIHPLAETEVPSDESAWLCPNCHAMVHEIRRMRRSGRKPRNYQMRLQHLDYWLSEICSPEIADKLIRLALTVV